MDVTIWWPDGDIVDVSDGSEGAAAAAAGPLNPNPDPDPPYDVRRRLDNWEAAVILGRLRRDARAEVQDLRIVLRGNHYRVERTAGGRRFTFDPKGDVRAPPGVELVVRSLQPDGTTCGYYACLYAQRLLHGMGDLMISFEDVDRAVRAWNRGDYGAPAVPTQGPGRILRPRP